MDFAFVIPRLRLAFAASIVALGVYVVWGLELRTAVLSAIIAFAGASASLLVPFRLPGSAGSRNEPVAELDSARLISDDVSLHVDRLRKAARRIADPEAAASAFRIVDAAAEALRAMEGAGRPLEAEGRKVIAYYLPETLKLIETLNKLESLPRPNDQAVRSVAGMLRRLEPVFDRFWERQASPDLLSLQTDLKLLASSLDSSDMLGRGSARP